jgi:hypothetical protein
MTERAKELAAKVLSGIALDVWEKGERLARAGHGRTAIALWNLCGDLFKEIDNQWGGLD